LTTETILHVDDSRDQHVILEIQLKLSGYKVLHAYSGQEAITVMGKNHVDLIILDVNMPGMDGFQTLKKIREQEDAEDVPVIFLSSLDRQYLKVKALEGGADDYLTKPYDNAELTSRIKARLRRTVSQVKQEAPRKTGTMQGDFQSMELADLVQSMSLCGKTCSIILPDMDGSIAFKDGIIVGLRYKTFYSNDAFLRLLLLQEGRFVVQFDHIDNLAGMESINATNLLLSGVSDADEIKEQIQKINPDDLFVTLSDSQASIPEVQAFKDEFPLPLLSVIVKMTDELKDNLKIMQSALADGRAEFVSIDK